jgi:hypothetical protein
VRSASSDHDHARVFCPQGDLVEVRLSAALRAGRLIRARGVVFAAQPHRPFIQETPMNRPDPHLVAQQLQEQRALLAEWNALSNLQRLAQVASFRAAQKNGRAHTHPFEGVIGQFTRPFTYAA